jgi:hypothetical protein
MTLTNFTGETMSLNWNAEKVPAKVREENWQLMEKAVWNSMSIGIPVLTEKNLATAVERTRMIEEKLGAYLYEGDEAVTPHYLYERLHLFVGLKTNASKMSPADFRKAFARFG